MGAGRLVCGPEGLLNALEVALVLPPLDGVSEIERLIFYRKALGTHLEADPSAFYRRSFEAESLSSSRVLLRWRDELPLTGWNPDLDSGEGTPSRLVFADLVEEILKRVDPVTIKSSVAKEDPVGKSRALRAGDLAILARSHDRGEDQQALDPGADAPGAGAIHVSTYHGAKGLKWPVVIAADLDSGIRSRLFSLRSVNLAPDKKVRLSDPLADRGLRLWLNPFGKSGSETREKMEDSDTGRDSLCRAEDEELRLLYVGITRARDRLVLPLEPGKDHPWLSLVGSAADALLALEESGPVSLDGSDPIPVRVSEFEWKEPPPLPDPASEISFPIRADERTEKPPAVLVPSGQAAIAEAKIGEVIEFGERLAWKGNPEPGRVGEAMHRIFAVEILNPESDEDARLRRVSDLLSGFQLESHLDPSEVAATVDRYRAFVQKQFSPVSEQVEVPFSYVNDAGQRVSGFIDHLLETEKGPVILDHKIFPGKREDWEEKALSYSGQLAAYSSVFPPSEKGRTIIHLVSAGTLIEALS